MTQEQVGTHLRGVRRSVTSGAPRMIFRPQSRFEVNVAPGQAVHSRSSDNDLSQSNAGQLSRTPRRGVPTWLMPDYFAPNAVASVLSRK